MKALIFLLSMSLISAYALKAQSKVYNDEKEFKTAMQNICATVDQAFLKLDESIIKGAELAEIKNNVANTEAIIMNGVNELNETKACPKCNDLHIATAAYVKQRLNLLKTGYQPLMAQEKLTKEGLESMLSNFKNEMEAVKSRLESAKNNL